MKFLLDTCTLLWLELDLAKVPASVLDLLRDPAHEIYMSPVTAWEIMVKWQSGKLPCRFPRPSSLPPPEPLVAF